MNTGDVTFLRLVYVVRICKCNIAQLHDPAATMGCFLFYEWTLGGAMMSILLVRTPSPNTHTPPDAGKAFMAAKQNLRTPLTHTPPSSTYPTHPSAFTRLLSSCNLTCSPIRETSFSQSAKGLADARRHPLRPFPPLSLSLSCTLPYFLPSGMNNPYQIKNCSRERRDHKPCSCTQAHPPTHTRTRVSQAGLMEAEQRGV